MIILILILIAPIILILIPLLTCPGQGSQGLAGPFAAVVADQQYAYLIVADQQINRLTDQRISGSSRLQQQISRLTDQQYDKTIAAVRSRLAWPLRKDDTHTHTPRSVNSFPHLHIHMQRCLQFSGPETGKRERVTRKADRQISVLVNLGGSWHEKLTLLVTHFSLPISHVSLPISHFSLPLLAYPSQGH